MATVRRKGPGRWEARWYTVDPASGVRARASKMVRAGTEDGAAREAFRLENEARAAGTPERRTVLEAVNEWVAHGGRRGSDRSTEELERRVRLYLAPDPLAVMPVAAVEADDLERYYRRLRARLSAGTVRHCHWDLSGSLQLAVRRRWRSGNPAAAVELPALERKEVEPPEPGDVARLLRTVDQLAAGSWAMTELAVAVRLAAATGARGGELCALRWRDVDLDGGTVRLARSQPRGGRAAKDTKAHTARTVALPLGVVEAVSIHRVRVAGALSHTPGDPLFLFGVREGDWSKPLDPNVLGGRWSRAKKKAGVECRMYDLRHFAVSAWLEAGVPLALAARQAGHARQSTTADVYSHVLERRQVDRSTAAAVDARVDLGPAT